MDCVKMKLSPLTNQFFQFLTKSESRDKGVYAICRFVVRALVNPKLF